MAMEGLVCSRAFQKHITLRGQRHYITPLIHAPPGPPIGPPTPLYGSRGVLGGSGDSPTIAQVIFEAKSFIKILDSIVVNLSISNNPPTYISAPHRGG